MQCDAVVDYLTREALLLCAARNITISKPQMKFISQWLLVSRGRKLIHADDKIRAEVYQSIFDQILENGPVIRILNLTYYFKQTIPDDNEVQIKYEQITRAKLMPLLENICSMTGTGKKDQEELFKKMTIYIIATNKLFNTKNSQMVNEAKRALHSIMTKQDLIHFTSRKKHYRIEYLDRLGKIMCGILIFNKKEGLGGVAIRDVVKDINVAFQNTMEALRINVTKCTESILIGLKAVHHTATLCLSDCKIIYKIPEGITLKDIRLFNTYNYLHLQYEMYLHHLREPLNRVKYQIQENCDKFKEIMFKLHDVIKFRLAVPTETVFPHFMELFQCWYKILMQLYYLVEINKINDEMVKIVINDYPFEEMASKINSKKSVKLVEFSLSHLVNAKKETGELLKKRKSTSLFINPLQRFCALTIAATGGLLVQGDPTIGYLPFQEQFITFRRKDFGRFAEQNYTNVIKHFLRNALKNPAMCIVFNISIDSSPLSRYFKSTKVPHKDQKITVETGIQTEHCLPPSTLESRTTYSWNIWDYRRQAIQLANLRRCKTDSAETNITYSSKDAMIQTYAKISSTHTGICSSSQLSRSVCHILDETEKGKPSNCPLVKFLPKN